MLTCMQVGFTFAPHTNSAEQEGRQFYPRFAEETEFWVGEIFPGSLGHLVRTRTRVPGLSALLVLYALEVLGGWFLDPTLYVLIIIKQQIWRGFAASYPAWVAKSPLLGRGGGSLQHTRN